MLGFAYSRAKDLGVPIQFCLSFFHSYCHSPHTGVSNNIWHIFVSQDGTFDGVMSGDTLSPCNTCSLPSHECTCDFAEGVDYYRPGGPRAILEQPDSQDVEATCSPLKSQVISAIEKSPPVSSSSPDVSDDEEQMLARKKRRKCRASTLSDSEASSDTTGVCDTHTHTHMYIYICTCVCVCVHIYLYM